VTTVNIYFYHIISKSYIFTNDNLSKLALGHSAENLAIVRRIGLNLLKQEKTHKNGITCRRKRAGWDNSYLMKVLAADSNLSSQKD
jgi:hypothetical protein